MTAAAGEPTAHQGRQALALVGVEGAVDPLQRRRDGGAQLDQALVVTGEHRHQRGAIHLVARDGACEILARRLALVAQAAEVIDQAAQLLAHQLLLRRGAVELGQEPVLHGAPAPAAAVVTMVVMAGPVPAPALPCILVPPSTAPCRRPVPVMMPLPRDQPGHGRGSNQNSDHECLLFMTSTLVPPCCGSAGPS